MVIWESLIVFEGKKFLFYLFRWVINIYDGEMWYYIGRVYKSIWYILVGDSWVNIFKYDYCWNYFVFGFFFYNYGIRIFYVF